jgi:hypothetical protein
MDFLIKETREILKYCKKSLLGEENHSFSKFLGKDFFLNTLLKHIGLPQRLGCTLLNHY